MSIAHFKLGGWQFAAGWLHDINALAYRTQCGADQVPNPDGSCAVCNAGTCPDPPTIVESAVLKTVYGGNNVHYNTEALPEQPSRQIILLNLLLCFAIFSETAPVE